jgi:GNAT superfamily N-acetyltransferase
VFADAFADYPWTRWTVDEHDHVQRVRGLQRSFMEHVALPHGEVWIAPDDHDRVASVAVWMLPDSSVPESAWATIGPVQRKYEGDRHDASLAAEATVAPLRPTAPHYYLGAVGTRADRQRQGFGTAVLEPVLERADADGRPAFLETSAESNVGFYSRLRFEVVVELDIPDRGPHVWAMLRTVAP